jgi:DNA-binding CsgD family transcriptional regulator
LLTGRQKEVVKLVAQGMSHRHIIKIMSIDEKIVIGHKRCIMRKFNLSRTTDLHFWLISHQLTSAQEKE